MASTSGASAEEKQLIGGFVTAHLIELRGYMAKALGSPSGARFALVQNLAVRSRLQGQGLGKQLLQAAESVAWDR